MPAVRVEAPFMSGSANFAFLSMFTEQMTSLLTSCHIQHVCLHYKSVYFILTINDFRKRLNACVSAAALQDILSILRELGSRA